MTPGPGDAGRRRLCAYQHRRRPALWLARPAHPLLVSAMTIAAQTSRAIPAIADDVAEKPPPAPAKGPDLLPPPAARHLRHGARGDHGACRDLRRLDRPIQSTANDFAAMTEPPSWTHPARHRSVRRDQLSRIIFGARTALIVGFSCAIVASLAGLVLGVGSAYFGGPPRPLPPSGPRRRDGFSADHHGASPSSRSSATGIHNVIIAITIPLIPRCARVLRSSALSIREVPYIDAARACGFGHSRIILRHMVAQCDGAIPDPPDPPLSGRRSSPRPRSPIPRPRRAGAGAGLGPDAARRRRGICLDGGRGIRHFPGPGDRADRLRLQPFRRLVARRPSTPSLRDR